MSQIWKLVGPDGKPYTSVVPGTLGGPATASMAVSTAPPRCAPSLEAATSRTVSSSSPNSTHEPLVTVPTPFACSKTTDWGASRYLREDGDFLGEPFKSDRWNDTTLATHHHSEGGTS